LITFEKELFEVIKSPQTNCTTTLKINDFEIKKILGFQKINKTMVGGIYAKA